GRRGGGGGATRCRGWPAGPWSRSSTTSSPVASAFRNGGSSPRRGSRPAPALRPRSTSRLVQTPPSATGQRAHSLSGPEAAHDEPPKRRQLGEPGAQALLGPAACGPLFVAVEEAAAAGL